MKASKQAEQNQENQQAKPVVIIFVGDTSCWRAECLELKSLHRYYQMLVVEDTGSNRVQAAERLQQALTRQGQTEVYAICCLAAGWPLTKAFLATNRLHYGKLILESSKAQPGQVALTLLKQAAAKTTGS